MFNCLSLVSLMKRGKKKAGMSVGVLAGNRAPPDEIQKELDEGVPYRVKGTFRKPQGLQRH